MASDVVVRRFQPGDGDSLIALWQRVLPDSQPWNDPKTSLIRKLNQGDGLVLVAERGGSTVGAVKAGYDGVRGWIYSLAVLPEYQRNGIGRKLIQTAGSELAARGCPKVNLQVRTSNSEVVEFYQRCGYDIEERTSLGKTLTNQTLQVADTFPPMRVTNTITLSRISWEDRASYLQHLNESDEFHRNTAGIPYPYTEFDVDQWLSLVTSLSVARDQKINLAIRHSNNELLGEIGALNLIENEQAEIGYWLAKPYWGRGIMPVVVRRFCEFAFDQFRLQRIYARVFATNPRSARVLSKVGFRHEGTLRNGYFRNGQPVDDLYFGLLHGEIQ
ncbi:MAG: GNAT family acetyltransferase [Planctomycetota bacterium]|jgi:RimJ/RimL family protein N-acetyltransferase